MINYNFINKLKKLPRHGIVTTGGGGGGGGAFGDDATSGDTGLTQDVLNQVQTKAVQNYLTQMSNQALISKRGKTYQMFDLAPENGDVIQASIETVTAGLWSDNLAELSDYYSGSDLTDAQTAYYVNVYQKNPLDTGSSIQYAIAYGNSLGSGSSTNGSLNDSPSRAIYGQYQQLLLDKDVTKFTTPSSGSTDSIYIINFQRNRTKEKLDAGNWELPLSTISASRASNATGSVLISGSANTFTLIDDSSINPTGTETDAGRTYNVVSGSIVDGVYNEAAPNYYGSVYLQHSTIVLDGDILDNKLGFTTNTGSNSCGSNHYAMFHSISGSYPIASKSFQARNQETVSSAFYFVRVKNGDFNYSNNPSYVTGSDGDLAQTSFIGDPKSYVTTIGLYNTRRELLAVAKLSQPVLKSKTREVTVKVKVTY
jgi:hypothetical protein